MSPEFPLLQLEYLLRKLKLPLFQFKNSLIQLLDFLLHARYLLIYPLISDVLPQFLLVLPQSFLTTAQLTPAFAEVQSPILHLTALPKFRCFLIGIAWLQRCVRRLLSLPLRRLGRGAGALVLAVLGKRSPGMGKVD
jgi:hypothetical protein